MGSSPAISTIMARPLSKPDHLDRQILNHYAPDYFNRKNRYEIARVLKIKVGLLTWRIKKLTKLGLLSDGMLTDDGFELIDK